MTEDIHFSESDLAQLRAIGVNDLPSFHTVLEVWRETLRPAGDLRGEKVTPQYASRMLASYNGLTFKDMPALQDRYYSKILELLDVLDTLIADDPDCLTYTNAEDDAENNGRHYKRLLTEWQLMFLYWELDWDTTAKDAAIELTALSEVHKAFFGPTGLTQFLESIPFEMTEADGEEINAAFDELREGYAKGGDGE